MCHAGSVLLVESQIGFRGRQDCRNLLEEILDAGVDVVAGGNWFKSGKYDLTDMIVALVGFSRATEESETKATQIAAVWVAKRERARRTGAPMSGKTPRWLERTPRALRSSRNGQWWSNASSTWRGAG